MKIRPVLAFIIFVSYHQSWSAISFYKSPESKFSSGESALASLQNGKLKTKKQSMLQVKSANQKTSEWVKPTDIIRAEDLIENLQNSELSYINSTQAMNGLSLVDTYLREGPSYSEKSILPISAHTPIRVLRFQKEWAYIWVNKKGGFVEARQILIAADFAYAALVDNTWTAIDTRTEGKLFSQNHHELSWSKIQGFMIQRKLGILTQNLIGHRVIIEKELSRDWIMSVIPDHGVVWWQEPTENSSSEIKLSVDELSKRQIASISFDHKNRRLGLLSAHGVFKTTDGVNWTQIAQFQDENHPVLITENGDWIVGAMISHDQGRTFEEYLRWDQVLQSQNESINKKQFHYLRILDIQPVPTTSKRSTQLRIRIDTGNGSITLNKLI